VKCPKCGLESDYRITNGVESYDICAFCGHEEKVGGEKDE